MQEIKNLEEKETSNEGRFWEKTGRITVWKGNIGDKLLPSFIAALYHAGFVEKKVDLSLTPFYSHTYSCRTSSFLPQLITRSEECLYV